MCCQWIDIWMRVLSGRRKLVPTRDLHSDVDSVPESEHRTPAQENTQLDRMLGQIANYCVVINRNIIMNKIYISCSNLANDQRALRVSVHECSFP